MRSFFRALVIWTDRLIWSVGCLSILSFLSARWPFMPRVVLGVLLLGFGGWFSWKFVIQPFRAGQKGE